MIIIISYYFCISDLGLDEIQQEDDLKNIIKDNSIDMFQQIKKITQSNRYHWKANNKVIKILRSIEKEQGKLPVHTKKLCDEYAIEVLGHKKYAYWLYVYASIAGEFREGWIPQKYFLNVVEPIVNGQHGLLGSQKSLNHFYFKDDIFPDIASKINGLFFDLNYKKVFENDLKDKLFANGIKNIVFKEDMSLRGRGIYFFNKDNFSLNIVKKLGNGIFQKKIEQHDIFNKYNNNSVATIRILTAIDKMGKASIRGGILRLGLSEETHIQSETQITVPIDVNTGELFEVGYTPQWLSILKHPSTNTPFKNNHIPSFKKCIESIKRLHNTIPFIGIIGWDLIVDKDNNVNIMEWNSHRPGIVWQEATQGPIFKDLEWEKL